MRTGPDGARGEKQLCENGSIAEAIRQPHLGRSRPDTTIALKMPGPDWRVNSEYGR